MSILEKIKSKIFSIDELIPKVNRWKDLGYSIVFTNGCFDILHKGHIEMLSASANLGDKLIVGINSDSSIKKLKGNSRPILDEETRSILISSLIFVDAVILFSEKTPINLINKIIPDILTKGGDYKKEKVVGYKKVDETGGEIIIIPLTEGFSSSNIIEKIKKYNG